MDVTQNAQGGQKFSASRASSVLKFWFCNLEEAAARGTSPTISQLIRQGNRRSQTACVVTDVPYRVNREQIARIKLSLFFLFGDRAPRNSLRWNQFKDETRLYWFTAALLSGWQKKKKQFFSPREYLSRLPRAMLTLLRKLHVGKDYTNLFVQRGISSLRLNVPQVLPIIDRWTARIKASLKIRTF